MKKTKKDAVIYTFLVLLVTILVYFLVSFILKPVPATVFDEGDFSNYFNGKKARVIIYGTSWCRSCAAARDYLKSKHVDFIDYDIDYSDDAKSQYLELGGKTVPLLLIGNRRLRGFNPKMVKDALAQLPQDDQVGTSN